MVASNGVGWVTPLFLGGAPLFIHVLSLSALFGGLLPQAASPGALEHHAGAAGGKTSTLWQCGEGRSGREPFGSWVAKLAHLSLGGS